MRAKVKKDTWNRTGLRHLEEGRAETREQGRAETREQGYLFSMNTQGLKRD